MANANSKSKNEPVNHVSVAETGTMEAETGAPDAVLPEQPKTGGDIVQAAMNSIVVAGEDAAMMFAEDANKGIEGATADSFAIPFLIVLQKGSPQVDEASKSALPGARQGMLFNTVTGDLIDVPRAPDDKREGVKPLIFIPCAFRQVWIRWGSRKAGGGFKGELTSDQVADMRRTGALKELDGKLVIPNANGSIDDKCDIVNDHRNHYGLALGDDDAWQNVLISLTSTQIKKSKRLMAAIGGAKMKHPRTGMIFQPPSWANKFAITTVPESNDKGNWMGIDFNIVGKVDRRDLYEAGKAFNEAIKTGAVAENYNTLSENVETETGMEGGAPSAARPDKF
ncbi:MAG TPA: hypothetical protein VF681_14650 [Abditibacteriaceae bacterium]